MSHFVVGVVLPYSTYGSDQEIDEYLANVLWRYDENRSVPEYDQPCGCADWRVSKLVCATILEQFGDFNAVFRQPWNDRVDQHPDMQVLAESWRETWTPDERHEYYHLRSGIRERVEEEMGGWKAHTAPYFETQDRLRDEHPLAGVPDEGCEDCHGTGIARSTYNPEAKWDWWVIGGRWDGFMSQAEDIIEGTDAFDQAPYDDKFKTYERNICTVEELLARVEADPDRRTFALLTDRWIEQGDMGWWGMVSDEKDPDEWNRQYLMVLR
ncbi:hypothetical protein LCGC14_2451130, partial [marine sediment metagenome]